MFGFNVCASKDEPRTLVVTGDRDKAIPAWASRFFAWWSGLPSVEVQVIHGGGHLLFHDHLDRSVPLIAGWLDERIASA